MNQPGAMLQFFLWLIEKQCKHLYLKVLFLEAEQWEAKWGTLVEREVENWC